MPISIQNSIPPVSEQDVCNIPHGETDITDPDGIPFDLIDEDSPQWEGPYDATIDGDEPPSRPYDPSWDQQQLGEEKRATWPIVKPKLTSKRKPMWPGLH